MSDLQNDDEIIRVLGLNKNEDEDDLVYTRLFPHYFIPDTQEDVKTYIMVEIDINAQRNRYKQSDYSLYSYPVITFTILAHQNDMKLDLSGISAVKTDYIAELIDNKYNGKNDFGLGLLQVTSNIAGSLNDTYRFRQIVFQTIDFNNGLC